MLQAILILFVVSLLAPTVYRFSKPLTVWLLAAFPAGFFIYLLSYVEPVLSGERFFIEHSWVPSLGISMSFLVDGLSLFFALLISGFGFFIILYSGGYLKGEKYLGRFYCYLILFMASMLGLVLSGDIIALFVFWELTSLSSYLLIGYKNNDQASRDSALQALLTTVLGGLALLAGLILAGNIAGSYILTDILQSGHLFRDHYLYELILILVFLGCFTKSAQVPFHYWLPNAMAAPTPVSAYLHSATMVKVGIFFLLRFTPAFGNTIEWQAALTIVGAITMVTGAFLAFRQSNMKKILAYTTISALGILVMMTGIGTSMSIKAAMIFLMAHAFYKATLFLVAGNVSHATGTYDINRIGGLRKAMPFTALAAFLGALSMAGVPPVFGFIGKEMFYQATLSLPVFGVIFLIAAILSSALFVVIAILFGYKILFSAKADMPQQPHETPFLMWIGPVILSLMGLVSGILPFLFEGLIFEAAKSVYPGMPPLGLTLWHGFNIILLLSFITLVFGFIIYRYRTRIETFFSSQDKIGKYGPEKGYNRSIDLLKGTARIQTLILQNGSLRYYIATCISAFCVVMLYSIFYKTQLDFSIFSQITNSELYDILVAGVIMAALYLIIVARSRLTTLATLGLIGYGMALFFLFFGAPDLSMTQILIETLTVILFVLVLNRLPRLRIFTRQILRFRYLTLSLVFGAIMTTVLWLVTSQPMDPHFKSYYAENAFELGKGRNIVNVILVDYRVIDTFGEIIVLGIAAIGIFSLMNLNLKKTDKAL